MIPHEFLVNGARLGCWDVHQRSLRISFPFTFLCLFACSYLGCCESQVERTSVLANMVKTRTSTDTHASVEGDNSNNLKRKAAGGEPSNSSPTERRDFSEGEKTLFLRLKPAEFFLSCIQMVEATHVELLVVEDSFVPLTDMIERSWYALAINIVSLRPGMEKLHVSSLGGLIMEFLAEKPEAGTSLWNELKSAVDTMPESFLRKIHHRLERTQINMDNAWGACILLRDYDEGTTCLDKSVAEYVRCHNFDSSTWWYCLVTTRHVLKQPLAANAFKTLSKEIATSVMKACGHPASWYANRALLEQKQAETDSSTFKTHDELLLVLNYLEVEGSIKIVPDAVDRDDEEFLLNTIVVTYIRTYFVHHESVKHAARIRAHR